MSDESRLAIWLKESKCGTKNACPAHKHLPNINLVKYTFDKGFYNWMTSWLSFRTLKISCNPTDGAIGCKSLNSNSGLT